MPCRLHAFIHQSIRLDVPLDKIEVPTFEEDDAEEEEEESGKEESVDSLPMDDLEQIKRQLKSEHYDDAKDEL